MRTETTNRTKKTETNNGPVATMTGAELDRPLSNRGFLLGCALIADAIEWASPNDDEVEGLAKILSRAHRAFREWKP
jgi:hypothetical protein